MTSITSLFSPQAAFLVEDELVTIGSYSDHFKLFEQCLPRNLFPRPDNTQKSVKICHKKKKKCLAYSVFINTN